MDEQTERRGFHAPTWIAIAVVAYALSNVAHEGLGHGGVCLLVKGHPQILTSVHFGWDESSVTEPARRLIAAGGTVANLLLGTAALLILRRWKGGSHGRFFLWLLGSINLFQAAGYWLFSGVGNIGDWAEVVKGWPPAWAWRVALAVLGAAAYVYAARLCARLLAPMLGREGRVARARKIALMAYFTGGALYCLSGILNPVGLVLVLISGAAASFGGTSGFLWFHEWLKRDGHGALGDAVPLPRHRGWITAGLIVAVFFMGVLGRGIAL